MTDQSKETKMQELFGKAMFDVEHALGMYALGFCSIPAEAIYDKEILAPLMSVIETCHIYIIGYLPIINLINSEQINDVLKITLTVAEKEHTITYEIPGLTLIQEEEKFYLENEFGEKLVPDEAHMQKALSLESNEINFEVKYIGQAYGKGGSRNAVDRLLKHETLQKIALKGVPDGHKLSLLMLSIEPNTQLYTFFNPFAKNLDEGDSRIESGLDKLFNTTEEERISLYEAALIRYFYPEFNTEFKDSFPSTNLKILQDCYKKDFSAVVAEINIDELPFKLCSDKIKPASSHIAKHDLHKDEDRKMFFGL